jgi:hypothetical protein
LLVRPSELTGRNLRIQGERVGYPSGSPPRGVRIHAVRIEAPTTSAADQLVRGLVGFVRIDLVPLEGDRWEVRVEESSDDELDAVLNAVARWAAECSLERAQVLVDDEPIELPKAS